MEPTQEIATEVNPAHAAQRPVDIDAGKAWRREHGVPVVGVFDGFRALAILAIVVFHCLEVSGTTIALGGSALVGPFAWALPLGVTALFIISGFVVYLPTVARGGEFGRIGHYFMRRAARILPAYWVVLGVAALLLLATSEPMPTQGAVVSHVLLLQTPVQLLTQAFGIGFGIVRPVWTLSLEAGCYLVLPLLAGWWLRRPFIGVAVSAAMVVAWGALAANAGPVAAAFGFNLDPGVAARIDGFYVAAFPAFAFAFACGMTGAIVYVRLRASGVGAAMRARAGWLAMAAGIAVLFFAYLLGHRSISYLSIDAGGLSVPIMLGATVSMTVLFVALSIAPRRLQLPFSNGPIRWLGDVSYGIYLIHFAVLWLVFEELKLFANDGSLGAALMAFALAIPVSVAYGYLSARFVERPVRRWAHRYGRRQQPPEPALPQPALPRDVAIPREGVAYSVAPAEPVGVPKVTDLGR
jgi:peptidoglycan/LPS O-acetylase OafA/YrhL